jgi:hypothetical protein
MARQRRFAEHRAWMIRSFALTTSTVVNRLWLVLTHHRSVAIIIAAASASVWLSWVVNLLIAEWWLQRRRAAGDRLRAR